MKKISRAQFASEIDGVALDREVERLARKRNRWEDVARTLVRRVNLTLDWSELGPEGSRYDILATRGEAVIFADRIDESRVLKLRGLEENGFVGKFGSTIQRIGEYIDYGTATIEEAVEREELTWREFGFACSVEAVVQDDGDEQPVALILGQEFINGEAPTAAEIRRYMESQGWQSQEKNAALHPRLREFGWRRGDVFALDANPTNLVKASADGEIYPIDLIVWPVPR